MQRWLYLAIFLLLASCQYFLSQEERTQQLVDKELMAIDWDDVDQYPLFTACDEDVSKSEQKYCFEARLMEHVAKAFEDLEINVDHELNETVFVDLKIDEHGFITVLNVTEGKGLAQQLPNFGEEVSKRLNDLTTVAPALKQGTPVSITMRLPLVLNTNN